jgi:uncharacterized HAD superfamily protein
MSHRREGATAATTRWLTERGLPFDELTCCEDKIACCVACGVELLIDDSPVNLQRAIEHDIRVATILHPWNREFCEDEALISARDWPALAARLMPLLEGRRVSRPAPHANSTAGGRAR